MLNFVSKFVCLVKKQNVLSLVLGLIFLFGFILGVLTPFFVAVSELFGLIDLVYVKAVLDPTVSLFGFLFKRILYLAVLFLVVFAFSLNKITYYFNFFILFIRAYFLGIAFNANLSSLGVFGLVLFVFAVFLQGFFACLGIFYFILVTFENKNCKPNAQILLNKAIISFLIALFGVIIEFIVLAFIFRPLSFYF